MNVHEAAEKINRRHGDPPLNLSTVFQTLLERHVPKLRIRDTKATGLAPCHEDRQPSFSADLVKCCWWCFACNRGGGVRDFAALVGEPWRTKRTSPQQRRLATVHSFALAKAKQAYNDWQRRQLINLTDQYRLLSDELDVAQIAYRAIHRRPDLYTTEEQFFWTRRLASLYDRLATLEHDLDLLTYAVHAAGRFSWWREVTYV